MKKPVLTFVLLSCVIAAMSMPVDEATARRVALDFWNTHRPKTAAPLTTIQTRTVTELQHMYVFANGDNGFVLVSADDCVRPVLGYSFEDPFPEVLNPELRFWLLQYERLITAVGDSDGAVDPRWAALAGTPVPSEPVALTDIPMLCSVRWNQTDPYNILCPYDSNYHERAVVGCVATAMAQIMKRWNHPWNGTGNHFYEHYNHDLDSTYGILSADFEHTTYRWDIMPDIVNLLTSTERAEALGTISYHCGVAVDMMYGPSSIGGSGAYSSCGWWASACAEHAFYEHFRYDSTTIQFRERYAYTDEEWLAMIDADLAAGRPIYYTGRDESSGHAFVLDGSNLDTMYHFNWGWGGYGNGYYAMSNLAPGSGGAGGNATYTFNLDQSAIFGIQPLPEVFDTVAVYDTVCSDRTSYQFAGYNLSVANQTTFLHWLDTVFELHLQVVLTNFATFSENKGQLGGQMFDVEYCYPDGLVMPECPYSKTNCRFVGWSRNRNGNDAPIYQMGDTVNTRGNITYYARWQDTTVAIETVAVDDIALWPNPTRGTLTLSLGTAADAQVMVLDAVGRTVLRTDVRPTADGSAKILLADLPDGLYTVQVRTSSSVFNQRVIKQ